MLVSARTDLRERVGRVASVESSTEIFDAVMRWSMADLRMLTTQTRHGLYPYGGVPWYSTTLGRDGIITALQMLWCAPDIALGVLRRLAAYQAADTDPAADAQPGKILHEMRRGETARLREVPFGLYYGSVDATPLFLLLAGLYAVRTNELDVSRSLWPAIEMGLSWIDGPGIETAR